MTAILVNEFWKWVSNNAVPVMALLTILGMVVPRVRKVLQKGMIKLRDGIDPDGAVFRKEVRAGLNTIGKFEERLGAIEEALYNGGKTGVLNHVAHLVARDHVEFENARYPGFECDDTGSNVRVTAAYRVLVGLSDAEPLSGFGWENCIDGPLARDYRKGFAAAMENERNFIGECDFVHPQTREHRGRWRVFAVRMVMDRKAIYSGRFTAAIDETARQMVKDHGWEVRMPASRE